MSTMSAKPKLWHRYVDDVLAIVKRATIDSTLQHLNSQHPDIAFTKEVVSNGRLPYLDATIRRNGNRVTTSVHRKPTDTGRYLSFDSHHPVSAKRSTVSALLSRALSVVSDSTEQTAELDVVKSTLLKNGYPAAFIDNELARLRGNKGKQQPVLSERDDLYSTTVVIPFVDKTTQAIQRVLRPLRIRVVGRPCQWKWSLENGLKDSIDPQEDTGVVYAINCRDCEAAYIGETGRTTNVRVAEHLALARHGRVDLSAAADHAKDKLQNYCLGTSYGARSRSRVCRRLSISLVRYRHGLEKFLEHYFIPIRIRFNPHDLPTDLLRVQDPFFGGGRRPIFSTGNDGAWPALGTPSMAWHVLFLCGRSSLI